MSAKEIVRRTAATAFALAVVGWALAGCQSASYEVLYETTLTEAVLEDNVPEDGPRTDEIAMKIEWTIESHGLTARITNPADTTAAILWEDATFTHGDDVVALVSTAPSSSQDLPQAPTIIPRRGQLAAGMLPLSNAEWQTLPNMSMGGYWLATTGLFGVTPSADSSDEERNRQAEAAVGQKFKIRLPVRTGDRVLTYLYDMRVVRAQVRAAYR